MWFLMLIAVLVLVWMCGFLWAVGGDHGGQWRGLGNAVCIGLMAVIMSPITPMSVALIVSICGVIWLCISTGYGDSSPLYRLFFWITGGHHETANACTRAVVGLLYGGSCGLLSVISGHLYLLPTVAIIGMANTVYWNCIRGNLPPQYWFGLYINMTEFWTGIGVSACGFLALL